MNDVTRILNAIEQEDAGATEKLLPLMNNEYGGILLFEFPRFLMELGS
jgi:hypothetical protein